FNILHVAARYGHIGLAKFILQQSLIDDIDCRAHSQDTALVFAAFYHYPSSAEIVRLLLSAGADVDAPGQRNKRPIHWAADVGNIEVIKVLLEHHCSLVPDDTGMTPQWRALKYG
ncbi:ankyrin, partial [Mollisia scopiformis]